MSSVHNDLHSWAAKARKNGNTTIEIDLATADAAADLIVELSTKIGEMEHAAQIAKAVPDGWQLVPTKLSPEMRRGFREIAMPLVAYGSLDAERAAREDAHWKSILAFAEVFHPAPAPQIDEDDLTISLSEVEAIIHGVPEFEFSKVRTRLAFWLAKAQDAPVIVSTQTNARPPARPELESLLAAAKARVDAMSKDELEAMLAVQRESYVRGEMDKAPAPQDSKPLGYITQAGFDQLKLGIDGQPIHKDQRWGCTVAVYAEPVQINVKPDGWLCTAPPGVWSTGPVDTDNEHVQSWRDNDYTCKPYWLTPPSQTSEAGTDGYVTAFYELAKLLDIGAQGKSPKEVWEGEMLPRIKAELSELAVLRLGIKRMSDEEECWAETVGEDPMSRIYLAAKLADADLKLAHKSRLIQEAIDVLRTDSDA